MRKAFFLVIAIIVGVAVWIMVASRTEKPYEEQLAHMIDTSELHICHDTNFNTAFIVPGCFMLENDTSAVAYSYARYAYYPDPAPGGTGGRILLEYSATVVADTTGPATRIDSIRQPDGYLTYSKSIRRQKIKFTYALSYPALYDSCVRKLKKEVNQWKAFSASGPGKPIDSL